MSLSLPYLRDASFSEQKQAVLEDVAMASSSSALSMGESIAKRKEIEEGSDSGLGWGGCDAKALNIYFNFKPKPLNLA